MREDQGSDSGSPTSRRGSLTSRRWQPEEDFTCVICQRTISMRYSHRGRCETIKPVCWSCECDYSKGVGKPLGGTFRDRRNVARGIALAEALHCEAVRQTWPKSWSV